MVFGLFGVWGVVCCLVSSGGGLVVFVFCCFGYCFLGV
jgi:hypothetical protein